MIPRRSILPVDLWPACNTLARNSPFPLARHFLPLPFTLKGAVSSHAPTPLLCRSPSTGDPLFFFPESPTFYEQSCRVTPLIDTFPAVPIRFQPGRGPLFPLDLSRSQPARAPVYRSLVPPLHRCQAPLPPLPLGEFLMRLARFDCRQFSFSALLLSAVLPFRSFPPCGFQSVSPGKSHSRFPPMTSETMILRRGALLRTFFQTRRHLPLASIPFAPLPSETNGSQISAFSRSRSC